ncbi:hypothetical protein [Actinophytocola sp.]|uniref:hypothetical protein n=1 Tax=Actinophytocola sp. TaxID=1872138 RepID=UPI002ED32A16
MRVLFVVLLLALAGCTMVSRSEPPSNEPVSATTSTVPSAPPGELALYAPWVDAVCLAYNRWTQLPAGPLPYDRDPIEEDRPAVIAYLTAHVDLLTELLGMFQSLPLAPTSRTQELVDKEIAGINEALPPMRDILSAMEFMPVESFEDVVFMADAHPTLLDEPTMQTLLNEDQVLAQAHDEAPNC